MVKRIEFGARKAVIFATGGFTHDRELRANFLSVPVYGGCAANSNEGDFVRIASPVGAQLRNMQYAWMCPVPLEKAVRSDPELIGMFSIAGDSMIFVNKHGRRVCNEKLPYNELAQVFFSWDGEKAEYPNLVLVQIWDERSQLNSASDEYGRLIVPSGGNDSHVIKGETLPQLVENIAARLRQYADVTGGLTLADDFLANLEASIRRFNDFASNGKDEDFARGERVISLVFNGDVREEAGRANPTMWPISDSGPYYAALVTGGTLDTKGGPKTNGDGKVLDDMNEPIPGLYGVGNCVASPSAQAYWAGGATLGPILAMAYRAANAAHAEQAAVDVPRRMVVRKPNDGSSRSRVVFGTNGVHGGVHDDLRFARGVIARGRSRSSTMIPSTTRSPTCSRSPGCRRRTRRSPSARTSSTSSRRSAPRASSGWRTCDHDEAVLCMDGDVTVRLVKLATPLALRRQGRIDRRRRRAGRRGDGLRAHPSRPYGAAAGRIGLSLRGRAPVRAAAADLPRRRHDRALGRDLPVLKGCDP